MRIKRAPLRASGMEGMTSCGPMGETASEATVTANFNNSDNLHCKTYKLQHGRTASGSKEGLTAQRDEETQAAKAKLRHYEELGHIKVEMDEDLEESSPEEPSPEAMVVTASPSITAIHPSQLQEGYYVSSMNPGQPQVIMAQVQGGAGGMVDVPLLSDSEGEYGFTVTVDDKERTTKSPMWLMSSIINKLYTNINKAVPFQVTLKKPPSIFMQLYVRAVLVFSSPEYLRINVNRCPNHAALTDPTSHDFPFPEHVVRADHPKAQYIRYPSGRPSVLVPLDIQQNSQEYALILFRFMCLGSCVGGINRRPISIVLTLENEQGDILGRKVIDVRVCACPTRDIKTDEQAASNKGLKRRGSAVQSQPVIRKKQKMVESKMEYEESTQDIYNIQVHGKQLYNFVMDMIRVYYSNHPEYALSHPDPSITSSSRQKSALAVKEKSNCRDIKESEGCVWKSEANSPVPDEVTGNLIIDSQDSPSHDSAVSELQQHLQNSSTMMVVHRETNGINSMNSQSSSRKSSPQPLSVSCTALSIPIVSASSHSSSKVVALVPSLSTTKPQVTTTHSDHITSPNGSLPRHIPVMQVSREPTLRRFNSDTKVGGSKTSFTLSRKSSLNVPGKGTAVPTPLAVEVDTSIKEEGKHLPGSPEMLAANVLVEGFAKKNKKL